MMTVCRIFYYQFYRFKNNFPSFKKTLGGFIFTP